MTAVIDGSGVNTTGIINSGTAQPTTSGTIVTFTGIPAGVKRVTVMLNSISMNTINSVYLIQIGSGSLTTSGYTSQTWSASTPSGVVTTGFSLGTNSSSTTFTVSGVIVINLIGSNTWIESGQIGYMNVSSTAWSSAGNSPALSGALDRIALTTVAGTATFTAGSVNVFWE